MPGFVVLGPFGGNTESDQVKGGLHIIINRIADTFGWTGTDGRGGTGGDSDTGSPAAPPPAFPPPDTGGTIPPDPVRQNMAATDP